MLLIAETKLLYLSDVWVCVLVASVIVFFVSFLLHVLVPIHKGDYRKLPNESALLTAMREIGLAAGAYMFPYPASMKDMGSPEMAEKYRRGPVGTLTVLPSRVPAIGKNLAQWFLYLVIVHVILAYVATFALDNSSERMLIFRVISSIALLAFSIPFMHESIWRGQSWLVTAKYILDGVIYSLATSVTFVLLWPTEK